VLYLRSREVPAALAGAVGTVTVLWVLGFASDYLNEEGGLGLLAVVAGTAIAGSGLAGADIDLDRTGAIAWPSRRAAHIIAIVATVIGIVTATALTGDQLAPAAQITRDAIGMSGVIGLGAATLGVSRAWIPLLTWTLLATLWAPPSTATGQQVLTWMIQPSGTTPATSTALILGATGVVAYAILGPRP